jgi:hypothetical protein
MSESEKAGTQDSELRENGRKAKASKDFGKACAL